MRARERTARSLQGLEIDHPALAHLFLGGAPHVLGHAGRALGDVYRTASGIAEVQGIAAELFDHDAGTVPWGCLTVEAEAFGCDLEWFDDYYPRVVSHPLEDTVDLCKLVDPDPARTGRMPLVLESLTLVRERLGDDQFVIALVVSPFLVAAELRGMEGLLADLVLKPGFTMDLLEQVTAGIERYVGAIASSGAADAIMFENAGAGREMLGPAHVERFVMPFERRLLAAARAAAPGLILIEHNCSVGPYVDEILRLDVDAVHVAHADPDVIYEVGMARLGTVDNQQLLLEGTPAEVERAALAEMAHASPGGFVLATSCEIPFAAPMANIRALSTARRAGR
jgi:uroporphyrinogen decarboxylase